MAKTTKADTQLGFDLAVIAPEEYRIQAAQKPRRCLHCGDTFASTGPGHRVCSPCKELTIWGGLNDCSVAVSF